MKNWKLLICLAVLALPACLKAQTTKIPAWTKFAVLTTDGVNVRKAPNAQSPKLMCYCEGYDGSEGELQWQLAQTPKRFEAFHLQLEKAYPILETSGDWVKLWVADEGYFYFPHRDVWIMKKFVREVESQPITASALKSDEYDIYHAYEGGTVLHSYFGFMDEMSVDAGVMAGDRCVVFPGGQTIGQRYEENMQGYKLDEGTLVFGKNVARNMSEEGSMFLFDPAKISEAKAKQLFAGCSKEGYYTVMYYVNNKLTSYEMSDKYPHETIVPATPIAKKTVEPAAGSAGGSDAVIEVVEQPAEFPGNVYQYLGSQIKYPKAAMESGIQGRVIVQFIVEKDGSITNTKVVRSPDPILSQEALRLVNSMPRWKPAMQKGEVVRSRYNLPIQFRLGD